MKVKPLLIVAGALFVILIIKDPGSAANLATGTWGLLDKLMSFFATLAQH